MKRFANEYNVKEIGVYEFQFVPPSWISSVTPGPSPSPPGPSPSPPKPKPGPGPQLPEGYCSSSSRITVILLVTLIALVLITVIVWASKNHKISPMTTKILVALIVVAIISFVLFCVIRVQN